MPKEQIELQNDAAWLQEVAATLTIWASIRHQNLLRIVQAQCSFDGNIADWAVRREGLSTGAQKGEADDGDELPHGYLEYI